MEPSAFGQYGPQTAAAGGKDGGQYQGQRQHCLHCLEEVAQPAAQEAQLPRRPPLRLRQSALARSFRCAPAASESTTLTFSVLASYRCKPSLP
ncbi:hypothetical protein WJX84_008707 [Apatococcus fuscideae]|uniref:Uncharacterized protein n=1 Tax=Apatococcus fuscideae TaxID=2026836 RepID=A0AAW1STX1_9CHLO